MQDILSSLGIPSRLACRVVTRGDEIENAIIDYLAGTGTDSCIPMIVIIIPALDCSIIHHHHHPHRYPHLLILIILIVIIILILILSEVRPVTIPS